MPLDDNLFSEPNSVRCIVHMNDRSGRFGNRMFMIASAYGLARLHSCHLHLSREVINEIRMIFALNFSSLLISPRVFRSIAENRSNPMPKVTQLVGCEYVRELARPNAIPKGQLFELTGFWQSYLYFIKYADELRQHIFIGKSSILDTISQFFLDIYQNHLNLECKLLFHDHHTLKKHLADLNKTTWIGIHVRRTDFHKMNYSSSSEYLFSAIRYFLDRFPDAHFIVASDDKPYCQNVFRNQSHVFVTPDTFSIGEDMITLSLCEHTVVTGGTFGWWAAFLANGEVIHDKVYPSGCRRRELYYPPWFLIDGFVRSYRHSNYSL